MSGDGRFDAAMYERIRPGAQASAAVLAPLIRWYVPGAAAVVDVGAGEGWLGAAFAEYPDCDVTAIEHPPPPSRVPYLSWLDLDLAGSKLEIGGVPGYGYDLALCLEVAEHLPPAVGPELVEFICGLAPVVAFSAAIPGQTGHGHVNCRWPSYWAPLFQVNGFAVTGDLRYALWNDERVEPWYRQNLLLAMRGARLPLGLNAEPLDLVHPDIYAWTVPAGGPP